MTVRELIAQNASPQAESVISRADGQAVQPWRPEPYALWSLLDMLKFYGEVFRQLGLLAQAFPLEHFGGPALSRRGQTFEEAVAVLNLALSMRQNKVHPWRSVEDADPNWLAEEWNH